MIFFRAAEYLKYYILSGHRKGHGIHSPFVFDLVSRVFRNKIDADIVNNIEKTRMKLISDSRAITVNDLGAGSVSGKRNNEKRIVSDLARYSSVPKKYGILLSNLTKEFGQQGVIELGTSLGISSMYMALAATDTIVHTIEGCVETAKIAAQNFEDAKINNIRLYQGSFDERLPAILDSNIKPGLVFIDGNHRKDALLKYFSIVVKSADPKTVIVVDDIYLSREMAEAWRDIKIHERVSVTIDLHRMGIVFFREGINHNHFVVRY